MIRRRKKHSRVLLFGCNSLALEVAGQLIERGWDLLLVTRDHQCLERAMAKGITTREVDYTDDDELRTLGIGSGVNVIFSLFEEDARNVFLTISAKYIDPDVLIITLSQSADSSRKLHAAGADKVIDPYEISGRKIYNMIRQPLIAETMEHVVFGQRFLKVAEVEVAKGSFLDGRMLRDVEISRRYNLLLIGVVDRELGDEFTFVTVGLDHKLDTRDMLVVIGPTEEIEQLRKDIAAGGSPDRRPEQ